MIIALENAIIIKNIKRLTIELLTIKLSIKLQTLIDNLFKNGK